MIFRNYQLINDTILLIFNRNYQLKLLKYETCNEYKITVKIVICIQKRYTLPLFHIMKNTRYHYLILSICSITNIMILVIIVKATVSFMSKTK